MEWFLAALAAFNLTSMITAFTPRAVPRQAVPWTTFAVTLLATEMAWIWLPVQLLIAGLLCLGGALDSIVGKLALLVLLVSWAGLARAIWQMTLAEDVVITALSNELGENYLDALPPQRRELIRDRVGFSDWSNPLGMKRPGVEVIKGISYGPHGVHQQLDIYRPQEIPAAGCPVLLQIHGGGWTWGDKDDGQGLPLMYHMASRGWVCVAPNYRLSPSVGFPTHLKDCKKALCWVREQGAEYGMDTSFVAVTGGSAGGNLTALMGLTGNRADLQEEHPETDTSVQAAVPFYGFYDFLTRHQQHQHARMIDWLVNDKVMHESQQENPDLWELASPISQLRADAPPFFILHGSYDSLIPCKEGRVFAEKLAEASDAAVAYAELPGAEHGWEVVRSLRTEHTVDAVQRFLEWALAQSR